MTSLKIFTDTADQERLTDELTSSSILARAVAVERMSGFMKYPILHTDNLPSRVYIHSSLRYLCMLNNKCSSRGEPCFVGILSHPLA